MGRQMRRREEEEGGGGLLIYALAAAAAAFSDLPQEREPIRETLGQPNPVCSTNLLLPPGRLTSSLPVRSKGGEKKKNRTSTPSTFHPPPPDEAWELKEVVNLRLSLPSTT